MTAPWAESTRRSRLPPDWPKRKAQVKKRAGGRCEGIVGGFRCLAAGTECDHIVRGDDHSLTNLQLLCTPCHAKKSSAEGNAAQPRERRTTERSPGLL